MPIINVGFNLPGVADPQGSLVALGPTLLVDIGWDDKFDYKGSPLVGSPASTATGIPALVDTGATESCIDEDLAQSLGLPLVDKASVGGAGGRHELNVYLAHIECSVLGHLQYGRFTGVKLGQGGQAHKALIGRTFLRDTVLIYDGRTGSVQICR